MTNDNSPDFETFVGWLLLLCMDGLLALLFRAYGWPVALGATIVVFVVLLLSGLAAACESAEPVIYLSQLPPDLKEPLEPFLRRGRQTLTVPEIKRFYRAAGELMEERADLFRHQTNLVNATTALELATAMAEFVASLSHEERAMLEYRRRHED